MELIENIGHLGIQVDSKLKFHTHTNTVTKKFTVFWAFLSVKILMLLLNYTILVHPIIEYDNVLWGPTCIFDNQKLECKATRLIPSINHRDDYNLLIMTRQMSGQVNG